MKKQMGFRIEKEIAKELQIMLTLEVMGIHSGFQGLLSKDIELLTEKSLSGLS